eukprot:evm.model.scf_28.3 EVM.evm.TU.scf_28.3   scf_28:76747-78138(+)
MYVDAQSTLWRVSVALLLCAATEPTRASGDRDEARVCTLGWGINAATLFVQFWLLVLVSWNRNSRISRAVAWMSRWASALKSACWKKAVSVCTCTTERFGKLLARAMEEEGNTLDLRLVIGEGESYLKKCNIDWVSICGGRKSLSFVEEIRLGAVRLDSSDAQQHAVLFDGEQQVAESRPIGDPITLLATRRLSGLHLFMTINAVLAVANTVGAMMWMANLPSVVGAAYATSRLGARALGLGFMQWYGARLPEGFYLVKGENLEEVQGHCKDLTLVHIWNLSDLCGVFIKGGENSTWWLVRNSGIRVISHITRGGVLWSKTPRWVEVFYNYPYLMPAACAAIGYSIFIWPYCWIAATLMAVPSVGWIMGLNSESASRLMKTPVVGWMIKEDSKPARFKPPFLAIFWISVVAVVMFYDVFIAAAGFLYTGVPYWKAVKRVYEAGDTACVLRDSFTTATEFLTLN